MCETVKYYVAIKVPSHVRGQGRHGFRTHDRAVFVALEVCPEGVGLIKVVVRN